jgi:Fur family iron response transcriptional regulator
MAISVIDPDACLEPADLRRLLESHGVRVTPQRLKVAEVLLGSPAHLSAEQIIEKMRTDGSQVSKATVYNTLKTLVSSGLVRQIHLDPERSVYDSTRASHHHFHDIETGMLWDFGSQEIEFSRFPKLPDGMEAASVEVVIRVRRQRK